jgi:pimeloyl-ACP methyl ester carboxylesterase
MFSCSVPPRVIELEEPMPDRTLVVPGTQATTLVDQNGLTVYNAVRVSLGLDGDALGGRPPEAWGALLGTEHSTGSWAPERTSLEPGTTILPGPVVGTPYDRLPRPRDFFGYDWRLDSRYNAQRLIDHLRAERPSDGRWNLIGHSQGGLVIVLASALTSDVEEFGRLVARVVLVGTPLAGTLRALQAITVGRTDFGGDLVRVRAARSMAQSWPALYQMLPAWDSVVDEDGQALPSNRQFTSPRGYPGAWNQGVRSDLLSRARDTHALLEGPFSRFGPGVNTLVIQGEKQATPTRIVRTGLSLATTTDIVGDRFALDFEDTAGDTLVPSAVTLAWGGKGLQERTLRIAGPVKEHAHICDGKFVTKKIAAFLSTIVAVVLFAVCPLLVEAQPYRVQMGGSGSFSEGYLLVGIDHGQDIGGDDCVPGGPICIAPSWSWLLGVYAGVVTESFPLTASGHVGIERKLSDQFSLGGQLFAFAHPAQWGVAARFDALDVGAVRAGYGWGGGGGFLLSLEVAIAFLRDVLP